MDQFLKQILDELRGMWRFRWYAMALVWTIAVVGILVVLALPDEYQARAQVYVDTRDPLVEGRREEEQDLQMKVAYVRRQILATPNLERVARETDLDLRAPDPAAFERLVSDLQDEISVRTENERGRSSSFESNVYNIIYQDPDRQTAQRVVQSLLNTFQEQSLEGDLREDVQALQFLDDQAATYRSRLEDAEAEVADFKRRNAGVIGEGGGFFSRLSSLQDERRKLRADLRIEQDRRRALQEQLRLSQSESSSQESGAASIAELEAQIVAAEKNLDELRLRYTDQHPSVISARETLESLRGRLEKRQQELGPLLESGSGTGALVQNVRMALATADVTIAELRGRERDLSERIAELEARVGVAPQLEAELAGLMRDYEVMRAQYEGLLKRREQLALDIERKRRGKQLEFRIIEPPIAGQFPVAPDRVRLLALVLMAALGAGAGLTFLLHQLKPVYISPESVYQDLQVPVLGSVSLAWTDTAKTKRRRAELGFVGGLALLLVFFGVVYVALPRLSSIAQGLVA